MVLFKYLLSFKFVLEAIYIISIKNVYIFLIAIFSTAIAGLLLGQFDDVYEEWKLMN